MLRLRSRGLRAGVELGLVMLNGLLLVALAAFYNKSLDLTPGKQQSLSARSIEIARRLSQDVQITLFYDSQQEERRAGLDALLRRFTEATPRIQYRLVDLDQNPGLSSRYGISNYYSGILEIGDHRLRLRDVDESEITTNLLRALGRRERIVLFSVGHGERDPSNSDPRQGLSQAAKALEAENYLAVSSPDLREGIPPEVSVVLSVAPRSDFAAPELAALDAHLARGGGVLLLLEADSPPRLLAYLGTLGIVPGGDLVVNAGERFLGFDSFVPRVAHFNPELLGEASPLSAILPVAQSIGTTEPTRPGTRVNRLAFTSEATWVDPERASLGHERPVFRQGIDHPGPVPIAAIAEVGGADGKTAGGLLLTIGDGDFAVNQHLSTLGNRDWLINLVGLVARVEELVTVAGAPPAEDRIADVFLSARQARMLAWMAYFLLPGMVLVAGGLVGWRRRVRSAA